MKGGEKSSSGRQPNYAHRIKAKMMGEAHDRIQSAANIQGPFLIKDPEGSFSELEGSLYRNGLHEKTSPHPKSELLSPGQFRSVKQNIKKTLQHFFSGLVTNNRLSDRTFHEFSALQASRVDDTLINALNGARTSSIGRKSRKSDTRLKPEVKEVRSPLGTTNRTSMAQSPPKAVLRPPPSSKERRENADYSLSLIHI
eukprot:TRINITY_DN15968_c0_g1_i1.p1 TRINITY_DN15968_c0_g1~~TRINITY_DN15968_c0_g1_i1.p1  ORF type:complete len:198 (-),score=23.41 TRINITY_DN15968_c0_g1_i1:60-653(-)